MSTKIIYKSINYILTLGSSWQFIALSLLCLVTFFYGMTSYPIVDMNEGLYAEIAREMLITRDYIVPHLNYIPYLEKPPLFYWLVAASYKIFGVSTFGARLIPSLSATFLSFWFWHFGKKLAKDRLGWLTGMILASSFGYIMISRIVLFDMLLTTMLSIALCCFYLWYKQERKCYLYQSYFALALAFLTKGLLPVAVAFLVSSLFLIIMHTPKKKILQFFDLGAILLFFVLTLPWCLLAAHKMPHFGWDYFINEQFLRFLNQRTPHDYHTGPFYFYLPYILAYLFPWSLLLPTLFKRWQGRVSDQDSLNVLCWIWFSIALIILSLSCAKGAYYMAIGTPPLAILIAHRVEKYLEDSKYKPLLILFIASSVILGLITAYILNHNILPDAIHRRFVLVMGATFLFSILGILLTLCYRKPMLVFILSASITLPLIFFGIQLEKKMQTEYNQSVLSSYIQSHNTARPVYLFQDYEEISTLLLFLKERLPIVDSRSRDLYLGPSSQEGKSWFINNNVFLKRLKKEKVYVTVLLQKTDAFKNLVQGKYQFCPVAKSSKAVIFTNDLSECH